jgi:RimJ/RimL family protein N-acetyltransferase
MTQLQQIKSIDGKHVVLRTVVEGDYSLLYAWRNDVESLFLWSISRRLVSFTEYTRSLGQSDIDVWLMIIDKQQNIPIGFVYTYDVKSWDRHAFLTMYITPSARGKKIGLEAGALFVQYLMDYFPFIKLYADVFELNPISHSFVSTYGFVQEGFFPSHRYYKGKEWGMYRLALYRDAWESRKDEVFAKITG